MEFFCDIRLPTLLLKHAINQFICPRTVLYQDFFGGTEKHFLSKKMGIMIKVSKLLTYMFSLNSKHQKNTHLHQLNTVNNGKKKTTTSIICV